MEEPKETETKTKADYVIDKFNECVRALDTYVPWFDLYVFSKYFMCSLCIYLIAESSLSVLACVVFYRIFIGLEIPAKPSKVKREHGIGLPEFPSNTEFRVTFAMLCEISARFCVEYSVMIFIYFLSYIGFSLLTFVLACYITALDAHRYLDERLLLEDIDEGKLRHLIRKLGWNMPKWLSTPDHERVEWVNKILKELWPYFDQYIQDQTERFIDEKYPHFNLNIEKLWSGSIPPRISSVNVRQREDKSLFVDLSLTYSGDFSACAKWVSGVEFEFDHLQMQADLQIELRDFLESKPFVGTILVHMEKPPTINPRLKKMATAIESFKPLKKAFIDNIQNSIKNRYPKKYSLAKLLVENLIDESQVQRSQSEKKRSTPFMKRTSLTWDRIQSRVTQQEVRPKQIVTYLQDNKRPEKRLSDPNLGYRQNSAEFSLTQSKELQKKTSISGSVDPTLTTSSMITLSSPVQQESKNDTEPSHSLPSESSFKGTNNFSSSIISRLESEPKAQNGLKDLGIEVNRSNEEFSTKMEFEPSEQLTRSKIDFFNQSSANNAYSLKTSKSADVLAKDPSFDREPAKREVSLGKWEGGLHSVIARDVESSKIAIQDQISPESATDNDSIQSDETMDPLSREAMAGILESNQEHGCIDLTTSYKTPNILSVTVHKVRNMPRKGGRTPNPYVKLHLQNQQLKQLQEATTEILENTRDPVFDQEFQFDLENELSEYTLKVTAKTKHRLAHSLGQVVLCFARQHSAGKVKERGWFDLADPKKDQVMCWVAYQDYF